MVVSNHVTFWRIMQSLTAAWMQAPGWAPLIEARTHQRCHGLHVFA
jgi:hypothetical protein